MTENVKPDYQAFAEDLMGEWPGLYDLDASEIFEAARRHNLIVEIPGGFDPDKHDDSFGVGLEKGEPFYEFAEPARTSQKPAKSLENGGS